MMAFVNERSLEMHTNWGKAFRLLLKATIALTEAKAAIYKDANFFFSAEFKQKFNSVPSDLPPDEKALLRVLLFRENTWKCWRGQRTSAAIDDYHCQDPNVIFRDISICEAAELKRRNGGAISGLLSAPDSQFGNKSLIKVKKANDANWVEVQNSESVEAVRKWIAQQRGFFDPSLNDVPRDYQTILEKAPERFQRTGRTQKVAGKYRRIYQECETVRQFYVDEGHPGGSAHLEVFDSVGNHLGEASIVTGDVDYSKADAKKKISN